MKIFYNMTTSERRLDQHMNITKETKQNKTNCYRIEQSNKKNSGKN